MRPIFIYTLGVISLLTACNSGYSNAASSADAMAKEQQMTENGFIKATVVLQNDASGCPVLLVFENGEKLDPINLDQSLAKDNTELWVKFSRLRMPPRCDIASAISIKEAQKKAK